MKRLIFLFLFFTTLFLSYEDYTNYTFNEIEDNIYDNYILRFNNCDLNTNNFIDIFSYFKDKDYKILEVVPTNSYNNKYIFYSSNLNYVLNTFKNEYINSLINDSKYTSEICIKEIKINTCNYDLDGFKNIIFFEY